MNDKRGARAPGFIYLCFIKWPGVASANHADARKNPAREATSVRAGLDTIRAIAEAS